MRLFLQHSRYIRIITLMIPIFLAFMGMRVPDFSRPHKPKPMRRAVLDKTPTSDIQQSIVKADLDPCILPLTATIAFVSEEYSPDEHIVRSASPLLLLRPFPPRAPPVQIFPA